MQTRLSEITNLTDARYAAAEGIDWIGFDFIKNNPRFISVLKAQEIKNWLSGPVYFGRFSGQDPDEIKGICGMMDLAGIEVSIDAFKPELYESAPFLFLSIDLSDPEWQLIIESNEALWADKLYGKAAWVFYHIPEHFVNKYTTKLPVFYSVTNKKQWEQLEAHQPEGLDLIGTDEAKPGFSDWEQIAEIIEILNK